MRLACLALAAAFLPAACAGQSSQHRARLSLHQDLSIMGAWHTPMRNGASGAPVNGVSIGGYLVNKSSTPLRCRASAFILIDEAGNAITPQVLFCTTPLLAPHATTSFTAEFATMQGTRLQLRFEHPDGSYEAHQLTIPRA